jgi:uncharacterized membrane protein YeaQ/YmgE (transglycosylase-associated protein family)
MDISLSDVIVWLLVGAIAGTLLGRLLRGRKEGFGTWTNIGVGLVGALVGGIVFRVFKIDLGLGQIAITAEDLVAAILGSLLFLLVLKMRRKPVAKGGAAT